MNNSTMQVNNDIEYSSLHGMKTIDAGKKFFIIGGPYDNDGQAQADFFADELSKIVGDKIVIHNLDDVEFSGYGKNGKLLLHECWKENEYLSVEDMIQNINIESQNMQKTSGKSSILSKLNKNKDIVAKKNAEAPEKEHQHNRDEAAR